MFKQTQRKLSWAAMWNQGIFLPSLLVLVWILFLFPGSLFIVLENPMFPYRIIWQYLVLSLR